MNLSNVSRTFLQCKSLKIEKRCISAAAQHRTELFSLEKKRQKDNVGRIEKIEVRYLGLPEDTTMVMNKGISTPFNCAQHLSDMHCKRSALALIDSNTPWDMHRPLQDSCTLQLLNFQISDPHVVNRAFWRTCSFMLGASLQKIFKDEADVKLHSFPSPNLKSGSFVYDISLRHKSWKPNPNETRAISSEMIKLAAADIRIERLDVHHDIALAMFKDNPYKREQLPSISNRSNGTVTVYRVGDHVDISRGPMMGSTRQLGKCTISVAHKLEDQVGDSALYRVQGVALPIGFQLNHVAYSIIENRSKVLNPARLPNEAFDGQHAESAIA